MDSDNCRFPGLDRDGSSRVNWCIRYYPRVTRTFGLFQTIVGHGSRRPWWTLQAFPRWAFQTRSFSSENMVADQEGITTYLSAQVWLFYELTGTAPIRGR